MAFAIPAHAYAENIRGKTDGWCFTPEGVMYIQDGNKLYGKRWIGGHIYDFGNNGYLRHEQWVDNRFHISEFGCYDNGFATIDGKDYFFKRFKKQTGLVPLDGKVYAFNSDGVGMTGFFNYEGSVYYADTNHVIQTGWQLILKPLASNIQTGIRQIPTLDIEKRGEIILSQQAPDAQEETSLDEFRPIREEEDDSIFQMRICCYYFGGKNGRMIHGRTKNIQDEKYAFADDGTLLRSTEAYGYRVKADGTIACSEWYYGKYYDSHGNVFAEDISSKTDGWCFTPEGVSYLRNENKAIGRHFIHGKLYDFGVNGYLQFDRWLDDKYHASELGYFDDGFTNIDGVDYYFENWAKQTGIVQVGDTRYAFGNDGMGLTGVFDYDGAVYYAGEDHSLQTGWQMIPTIQDYYLQADDEPRSIMCNEPSCDSLGQYFAMTTSYGPLDNPPQTGICRYYFDKETGQLVRGRLHDIKNDKYAFAEDGTLLRSTSAYGCRVKSDGTIVRNEWYDGRYYDSEGSKMEYYGSEGSHGRLFFPEQGNWSVALNTCYYPEYAEDCQYTADLYDSAAYIIPYSGEGCDPVIADHSNQGFNILWDAWVGETVVIVRDGYVYKYEIVDKQNHGYNYDYGIDTIYGNPYYSFHGCISMYTCNSNWQDVTVVWMRRYE